MSETVEAYESDTDWEQLGLDSVEQAPIEKSIVEDASLCEVLSEYGCDSMAKGILAWRDWAEEQGVDPNDLELDR